MHANRVETSLHVGRTARKTTPTSCGRKSVTTNRPVAVAFVVERLTTRNPNHDVARRDTVRRRGRRGSAWRHTLFLHRARTFSIRGASGSHFGSSSNQKGAAAFSASDASSMLSWLSGLSSGSYPDDESSEDSLRRRSSWGMVVRNPKERDVTAGSSLSDEDRQGAVSS